MNVDDVVRIKIEEAARKIAAARKRRAELDAARQHGLAARHRTKLARLGPAEALGGTEPTLRTLTRNAQPRPGVTSFQAAHDGPPEVA